MNNFDHAIEATETALNSAGSAARENSRYMEGLEAKTQAVKASFQELANSVIDSGLVKGILDLANGFLQLLNTPIGNFITQMILLTGVFWGGTGLIKAMKLIPSFFSTAATAISGFTGVLSLTAPQLMLVAAGISAILAIAPAISNWWKEFTGDVEYLNEKIGEYSNQLSTNKDRLKDLLSIPVSSRTEEIENEITLLQMENEELENNIRLYKERVNKSSLSDIRQQHWAGSGDTFTVVWEQSGEKAINETVSSVEEAIAKLKEYGYAYEGAGDSLEDFNVKLEESEDVLLSSDDYLEYLINNTDSLIKSFENVANASEEEKQSFIDTYNQIQAYADTLQYASENGEVLSEAEKDLIDYAKELENGYSDLLNQMYPVEDSLNRLAEGAALNANEFSNLVSIYPDLADALEESDGLYKINQESLYNLASQGNETARALIEAQIEATKQILEHNNNIKVIMLTSHISEDELTSSLNAGASAYVIKDISTDFLMSVIRMIKEGAMWIDPHVVPFIRDKNCGVIPSRQLSRSAFKEHHSNLTQREYEVLKLVVDGQSNSQIAKTLTISEHTAKAHVCNIIQKLVVDDRTQAAVKALKEGLV